MKSTFMIIFFFICDISTLILTAITPFLTRKTQSFGIAIPEEVHSYPEIKKLRNNYRSKMLVTGGIISMAVLTAIILKPSDEIFMLIPASMLVILGMMYLYYMSGHKKMKELKARENWAVGKTQLVVIDTAFRNKKMMASPLWFMLYGALIFATAIMGIALYDKIPARIAMHWNIEGKVDRWADKSYKVIMWAPAVQVFITFVMMYSYWMIGKAKQLVNPSDPEKSSEQNRVFRYRWSVFMIITGLALLVMFGVIQFFSFGFVKNVWPLFGIVMIIPIGILIGSITLSIKTGQGGSRLSFKGSKPGASQENNAVNRDEDKYWKAGLIYYNPNDPSIFVEKRFGIGWTVNFGRPLGTLIFIGLLGAIAAFMVITIFITK